MTRIWIISKYASSPKFGFPTRHYFLAKEFALHEDISVTVIGSKSLGFTTSFDSFTSNSFEYQIDGINFVILNGLKINSGFSVKRIWSWIVFEIRLLRWSFFQKNNPDIIIVSSLSLMTFLSGIILKFLYSIPLIIEVRDIWPLTIQHIKRLSKYNPIVLLLRLIENLGYRNADLIIGTMPNLQSHINRTLPNLRTPVVCYPMGFDKEYFETQQLYPPFIDFFNNLNIKKSFIVGYVGSIGLVNSIEELIPVAKLLSDDNIKFVFLGDGPRKEIVISECQKLKLNNVFFHDSVDRKYVQHFLSFCDILVNPIPQKNPVYEFGVSPNKWVDYMYSGKPIIISYDGFKSIINEANCGEFIEPANPSVFAEAILKYKNMDIKQRNLIGANGKRYLFAKLQYKIIANDYLNSLKKVKNEYTN